MRYDDDPVTGVESCKLKLHPTGFHNLSVHKNHLHTLDNQFHHQEWVTRFISKQNTYILDVTALFYWSRSSHLHVLFDNLFLVTFHLCIV